MPVIFFFSSAFLSNSGLPYTLQLEKAMSSQSEPWLREEPISASKIKMGYISNTTEVGVNKYSAGDLI